MGIAQGFLLSSYITWKMNHYNSLVALSQIPYLVKLRSKMNLDCCWEEDVVVFVSFNVSLFKKQRFMLNEDCINVVQQSQNASKFVIIFWRRKPPNFLFYYFSYTTFFPCLHLYFNIDQEHSLGRKQSEHEVKIKSFSTLKKMANIEAYLQVVLSSINH